MNRNIVRKKNFSKLKKMENEKKMKRKNNKNKSLMNADN